MAEKARCKFTVIDIQGDPASDSGATITLNTQYEEALSKEDVAFSKATPWGEMTFGLNNPALADFFKLGKAYYVDITPA